MYKVLVNGTHAENATLNLFSLFGVATKKSIALFSLKNRLVMLYRIFNPDHQILILMYMPDLIYGQNLLRTLPRRARVLPWQAGVRPCSPILDGSGPTCCLHFVFI